MSFFKILIGNRELEKHDGRPLWKYFLSDTEYSYLKKTLYEAKPHNVDSRDVALYYAQWWKKNYNGGKPSKAIIFESIESNCEFGLTRKEFYEHARLGGERLGINWIKKQNTLYFKTLLLQGGLPLLHISENQGKYKAFLEAVLMEQPDTIEDFIFKSHIIDLLPRASQNDVVYENCLEIVKSIISEDGIYDELLDSDDSLKDIESSLRVIKEGLSSKRQSKPKNYWLIRINEESDDSNLSLRFGMANVYDQEALSGILGFELLDREYKLFADDYLICVFRQTISGKYKTDWFNQEVKKWDVSTGVPSIYVVSSNEKKVLTDFVQTFPDLYNPSLWSEFNSDEWRLVKGCSASNKKAAVLFPNSWRSIQSVSKRTVNDNEMSWLQFEGEIELESDEDSIKYLSGVNTFDWLIRSEMPKWMIKSNMPVVLRKPKVVVFDDDGYDIEGSKYKVYLKKNSVVGDLFNSTNDWKPIHEVRVINGGLFDIKIVKDDMVVYDTFFNIDNLYVRYSNQELNSAKISVHRAHGFECKLYESIPLNIEANGNEFLLAVDTKYNIVPTSVKASIGHLGKKKLHVQLMSPFAGVAITDSDGVILNEEVPISLANLYGIRLLSISGVETIMTISNELKPDVKITKEIQHTSQPLIAYKEEIERLFYLDDAMNHKNCVLLELSGGEVTKTYQIIGFSHFLDVEHQLDRNVSIQNSSDNLSLLAVPMNCNIEFADVVPLLLICGTYAIPATSITKQFIVISSNQGGKQLMPRFVDTDKSNEAVEKNVRIEKYHQELKSHGFDHLIWSHILNYFQICIQYELPFSTFDQLRAISKSPAVAARAFLFLGGNQPDTSDYIQKLIPDVERDLGFCFHWVRKDDWGDALIEIGRKYGMDYYSHFAEIISVYMENNSLGALFKYISGGAIEAESITKRDILDFRSRLGSRVLNELPRNSPRVTGNYRISLDENRKISLLIQSPIAVAESISGIETYSIWAGGDKKDVVRRNIQYSQYLNRSFYNKLIMHTLKNSE